MSGARSILIGITLGMLTASASLAEPPAHHVANSGKAPAAAQVNTPHRGSGPAFVGGTVKKAAGLNGTGFRTKH